MGADLQALLVEQVGFGRLEDPFEALALGLAGVDLHAVRRHFEKHGRALRRRHQRVGGAGNASDCHRGDEPASNASHVVSSSLRYLAATTSISTSMPGSARPDHDHQGRGRVGRLGEEAVAHRAVGRDEAAVGRG